MNLTTLITLVTLAGATPQEQASGLLAETLAADRGPGITAAVVSGECLLWSDAQGKADLEHDVELTSDALLRLGSVSKIVTAALALRLIDAGRLDPDSDVRDWVPEWPDKGDPVTPRQLASHTAGIRHYDFGNYLEANNIRYYEDPVQALAVFAQDPLLHQPGTGFHYSSFGFNLLGMTAARAAGTDFAQALAKWVASPLSLDRIAIDHPLALIPGRSDFYTVTPGGTINTIWRDSSDYYPAAGILANAPDLARLVRASFRGDFLGATARGLITGEVRLADGTPTGYTFGWQRHTRNGVISYEHGGETNGAYAYVVYRPAGDLAVVGITNWNYHGESLGEPGFFALVRDRLPQVFEGAVCPEADTIAAP